MIVAFLKCDNKVYEKIIVVCLRWNIVLTGFPKSRENRKTAV